MPISITPLRVSTYLLWVPTPTPTPTPTLQSSCLSFLIILYMMSEREVLGMYDWALSVAAFINSSWFSAHLSLILISQPINQLLEKSASWERAKDSRSDGQEIPCILRNPKIHYLKVYWAVWQQRTNVSEYPLASIIRLSHRKSDEFSSTACP